MQISKCNDEYLYYSETWSIEWVFFPVDLLYPITKISPAIAVQK